MYPIKIVITICCIAFSLSAQSITLNLPQEESEKDIKYKDWVIDSKSIPPVSKRNPDPTKGPRIPVKEIKIQGVKTYPDLSISQQELDEIVEKKRYELMEEEFLQKSGYTIKELLELAEVLNKIDHSSNDGNYTDLPEIQKLIWLLKEQKKNRGLTLGEIEEIAETITTYYRTHGFFLAKAFVPSQDVYDGIVGLTVLEGVLGKVSVEGNQVYSSDLLTGLFNDLKHKPVLYENIEQKLYLLNDYPGLKLTGYFRPGDQIGDTHLNLNVISESGSTSLLRIDNHGSEFTGENRLYFQYQKNSPLGYGDSLSFGVMRTSSPDNSTYGSISYRAPFFNERNYLVASISRNQYLLEGSGGTGSVLDLNGVTDVSSVSYEHVITRTRRKSSYIKIDLSTSQSIVEGGFKKEDSVDSFGVTYNYDLLSDSGKSVNSGRVRLSNGDFTEKEPVLKNGSLSKLNFSHHYLKFSHIPLSDIPVRFITKFNMQYSEEGLPSVEQMAIGGPDATRAYPINLFSADAGAYLGLEAHFNYPKLLDFKITSSLKFSELASPYLFLDYSHGRQYDDVSASEDAILDVAGYGFGLEFKYTDRVTGHLTFAKPDQFHISLDQTTNSYSDETSTNIIMDIQYKF